MVELGEGMKLVAPIARGLNVSLEETSAALATLSDAGLKGTLAGTGLRRILAELESPTAATADILQRFGITTDQVRVSQVGLAKALTVLKDAGVGAGAGLEIFGQRGGPAFAVLSENIPKVEEMTKVLGNVDGVAQRTANAMDNNLNGALLRVKSAFEGVILSVGDAGATGGLRGLLESLASGLRFVAENADKLVSFVQNLALFMGPRYLLGAIKAITIAIAANPLGLLLTVIAAVAAAIPDLQNKITGLVGTIGDLAAALLDGFDVTTLLTNVASAIDRTVALLNGFGAAAGAVFDALSSQPEAAGEVIKKAFRDALEASLDFFLGFAQTVGNIILGIGEDFISLAANVGGAIGAISTGSLDAAQAYADNLESTLLRTANRVTTFNGQFASNLKKLNDVDILPVVELSKEAFVLGNQVSDEFERAFNESTPTAQEALDKLLGPKEDVLSEAERRAAEIAAASVPPEVKKAAVTEEPKLGLQAQELIRSLDATRQLTDQEATLNEVLKARRDLFPEINAELGRVQIAALEASTTLEDGFKRAFLKISQEAQDLASVAEGAVNAFADNATDALVNFAETGQFSFKEFASSLLKDITRIITRLLVLQAIQAAAGAVSGGATTAGTTAAGAYADGGTTQPGRSYLVGEEGPELFTPGRTGAVTPNPGTTAAAAQAAPPIIQVINVSSEDEIPNAIAGGGADEAIINAIARNKDRVNSVTR